MGQNPLGVVGEQSVKEHFDYDDVNENKEKVCDAKPDSPTGSFPYLKRNFYLKKMNFFEIIIDNIWDGLESAVFHSH